LSLKVPGFEFGRRFNHSTIGTTCPEFIGIGILSYWHIGTFPSLAYCFCSFVLYALPYRTNAYFFPLLWSFQIAATQWTEVLLYKSDLTGFQNLSGLAGADDFRPLTLDFSPLCLRLRLCLHFFYTFTIQQFNDSTKTNDFRH